MALPRVQWNPKYATKDITKYLIPRQNPPAKKGAIK